MSPFLGFLYILLLTGALAGALTLAALYYIRWQASAEPERTDPAPRPKLELDPHDPAYPAAAVPDPEPAPAPASAPATLRPSRPSEPLPTLSPTVAREAAQPLAGSGRTVKPDADLTKRIREARKRTAAVRDADVEFHIVNFK